LIAEGDEIGVMRSTQRQAPEVLRKSSARPVEDLEPAVPAPRPPCEKFLGAIGRPIVADEEVDPDTDLVRD